MPTTYLATHRLQTFGNEKATSAPLNDIEFANEGCRQRILSAHIQRNLHIRFTKQVRGNASR